MPHMTHHISDRVLPLAFASVLPALTASPAASREVTVDPGGVTCG